MILLGDFNYDSLKTSDSTKISDIEESFELKQQIIDPTRVTLNSSTIIDHIYVSVSLQNVTSGVLPITVSDHYLVFSLIPLQKIILNHILLGKETIKHLIYNNF